MRVHLPAFQVVTEARDFLKAANILQQRAESSDADTDLFLPAALNAGLASEHYLKSFLVESDPAAPSFLKLVDGLPRDKHDLFGLYQSIPADLCSELHRLSDQLHPGFPLVDRIKACSRLFVTARYGYEASSLKTLRSEVFQLAPHLERILFEMTRTYPA